MLRTLWGRINNNSNGNNGDRDAIYNDQDSYDESVDYSYLQEHCHFLLLSQKEVCFSYLNHLTILISFNNSNILFSKT